MAAIKSLDRRIQAGLIFVGVSVLALLLVFVVLPQLTSSKHAASASSPQNLGAFAPQPGVPVSTIGEIGPGACWPPHSFAQADGGQLAAKWYRGGFTPVPDPKWAANADTFLRFWAGYSNYQPDSDKSASENVADYTERGMTVVQLTSRMMVQNTFCDSATGQVVLWKVQVFQPGEWVGFVKGFEPGNKLGNPVRPIRRMSCGNFLLPPPPPPATTTTVSTTTTTTPPTTTTTTTRCTNCKGTDSGLPPCSGGCSQPGIGGSPGTGGAVQHGTDGLSPSDPAPAPIVTTVPPPPSSEQPPSNGSPPTTQPLSPPG